MRRLLILGALALISTSKGDVKHVLDGSAHPPPCYQEHQHYHHDGQAAVPGSVPFWWAAADSPFKQAYEYFKKCSSKSDCLPPVAPSFQVPERPKVSNDIEPAGPGNFENNPFLNGQISDVGHTTPKIDLSRNPFLNTGMQAAYASTGQAVSTGAQGFLGVQPAVPFGSANRAQPFPVSHPHGDHQKPPFASQHPNQGGQPFPGAHPSCDKVCVPSQLCVNGIVNGHDSDCTPKLSVSCHPPRKACP
ncbi:uncharacterized protein LOC116162513 [Photinus pyralis]|uniref:uncharacterized protein LOC116162513 n=1 Tax=Photinus pyralis TaxID=7054 RepID=UPI00126746B3|nr:uncharacterized protein LOC116162513 [Photinus pyralis]